MATCPQGCAYSSPTVTQATCFYPSAPLVTKRFLNHFAPSFCNILQQIKHPLLGMFSICFMLILIKEFETEQTVPSRWPYKCEISKLFYLPQTPLVNFFKLIQASESLLIPRRKLSNPSLQIFAFVTAPGANDEWCPPYSILSLLNPLLRKVCHLPQLFPFPSMRFLTSWCNRPAKTLSLLRMRGLG